jgi:hypothetical protein
MRPAVRVGAASPFGLALPDAHPSAAHCYAPRGVWLDDDHLIVADSGNHRVLIWHGVPSADEADADVVLGQPTFTSEGAHAGGRGVANGLHLPTGVAVIGGQLVVADAWHHRVLVYDGIPTRSDTPPAYAIGQRTLDEAEVNAGGAVGPAVLNWPYGIGMAAGWFWICDTGNRRVLGWPALPGPGEPAHVVLGQDDFTSADENRRGERPDGSSFRWPHAVAGAREALYVTDAGNHRVLGWPARPGRDEPAALVLGQADARSNFEMPHRPQGAHRLRFPYAVAHDGERLAVADTANNRVLLWDAVPAAGCAVPASQVIGQVNFDAAGENRWTAVADDTLCWPYGLALHGDRLAIADSGNNRVMLWDLAPLAGAVPAAHAHQER